MFDSLINFQDSSSASNLAFLSNFSLTSNSLEGDFAYLKYDISADVLNKEREIYLEQAKTSNKPDNIIEKMVEGRVKKFYKENVLLEQVFVKDPNKTIKDIVTDTIGKLGENIVISRFQRFQLGDK